MRWFLGLAAAAATLTLCSCLTPNYGRLCDELCTELVTSCGFEAYPDKQSCIDGCHYDASEGAGITWLNDCVQAADCDTFEVMQCQREYGRN